MAERRHRAQDAGGVQAGVAVGHQLQLLRLAHQPDDVLGVHVRPARSTPADLVVGALDVEQGEVRAVLGHEHARWPRCPGGCASPDRRRGPSPPPGLGAAAAAWCARARRTGSPWSGSTSRRVPWPRPPLRRCRRCGCSSSRSSRTAPRPRPSSCVLRSRPCSVCERFGLVTAQSITHLTVRSRRLTRGSMPRAYTAAMGAHTCRAHRDARRATRSGRTLRCASRCSSASTATPACATARRSSGRSSTTAPTSSSSPSCAAGATSACRPARSTASTRSRIGRTGRARRVVGRAADRRRPVRLIGAYFVRMAPLIARCRALVARGRRPMRGRSGHPRIHRQPGVDARPGRGVRRRRLPRRDAPAARPRHDGRRHARPPRGPTGPARPRPRTSASPRASDTGRRRRASAWAAR